MTEYTSKDLAEGTKNLVWGQVASPGRDQGKLKGEYRDELQLIRATVTKAGGISKLQAHLDTLSAEERATYAEALKAVVTELDSANINGYRQLYQANQRIVSVFIDPTKAPKDPLRDAEPQKSFVKDARSREDIKPGEHIPEAESTAITTLRQSNKNVFNSYYDQTKDGAAIGAGQQLQDAIDQRLAQMLAEPYAGEQKRTAIRQQIAKLHEAVAKLDPQGLNGIDLQSKELNDLVANFKIQLANVKNAKAYKEAGDPGDPDADLDPALQANTDPESPTPGTTPQELTAPMIAILREMSLNANVFNEAMSQVSPESKTRILAALNQASSTIQNLKAEDANFKVNKIVALGILTATLYQEFHNEGNQIQAQYVIRGGRKAITDVTRGRGTGGDGRQMSDADMQKIDQINQTLQRLERSAGIIPPRRSREDHALLNNEPGSSTTPGSSQGPAAQTRRGQNASPSGLTGELGSTDVARIMKGFESLLNASNPELALSNAPRKPGNPPTVNNRRKGLLNFVLERTKVIKDPKVPQYDDLVKNRDNFMKAHNAAMDETAREAVGGILVSAGVIKQDELQKLSALQIATKLAQYNAGAIGKADQEAAPAGMEEPAA